MRVSDTLVSAWSVLSLVPSVDSVIAAITPAYGKISNTSLRNPESLRWLWKQQGQTRPLRGRLIMNVREYALKL